MILTNSCFIVSWSCFIHSSLRRTMSYSFLWQPALIINNINFRIIYFWQPFLSILASFGIRRLFCFPPSCRGIPQTL